MASTMASDLELRCRVLFWLERVAFFSAYVLAAASPASWLWCALLSLAFQVMSFVRSDIQSESPESKSNSWILFIAEHLAAILLEAYLIFGLRRFAAPALLLFEASSAIHLLVGWGAKQSGEVAKEIENLNIQDHILERKVWEKIIYGETEKTEEVNSVAEPVEPKVELEVARLENLEKETAEAKPNPTPAEAVGLEDKTSDGQVDKLEETANLAAYCEAKDEEVLNTSQAMSISGSPRAPLLAQLQESSTGDKSRPSKTPRHKWAPPPAPVVGMSHEFLQIRGGEDCCSLGRGYYGSPWANERDYFLEELDKAKGVANMYQQLAVGYSKDIHQLTMEKHQLASKLEDLTALHEIDREERELLRKSFKALCDRALNLARRTCNEASCAKYYKECCLKYGEGKGLLQEENARLQEENAQLEAEVEELRKWLNESECKRQALEENAQLGAEMEELRKRLDESECKRQALEEEKTSLDANLRGAIALCEIYCFVLKYISLFGTVNS